MVATSRVRLLRRPPTGCCACPLKARCGGSDIHPEPIKLCRPSPRTDVMTLSLDDLVLVKDLGVEGRILGENDAGAYTVEIGATRRVIDGVPEDGLELLSPGFDADF